MEANSLHILYYPSTEGNESTSLILKNQKYSLPLPLLIFVKQEDQLKHTYSIIIISGKKAWLQQKCTISELSCDNGVFDTDGSISLVPVEKLGYTVRDKKLCITLFEHGQISQSQFSLSTLKHNDIGDVTMGLSSDVTEAEKLRLFNLMNNHCVFSLPEADITELGLEKKQNKNKQEINFKTLYNVCDRKTIGLFFLFVASASSCVVFAFYLSCFLQNKPVNIIGASFLGCFLALSFVGSAVSVTFFINIYRNNIKSQTLEVKIDDFKPAVGIEK
ncbi:MAG: hypothetical protein HRK26_01755 [Rickettsiaceae bacterium H1]|nr:hypothetical protein [Rickettsiaceae bacterium H1]